MKIYKTIFLFLTVTLISFNVEAQKDSKGELDAMAMNMFEKTNYRDFDALLDMTYPKIYDLVPKEEMKNLFISMFQGTDEMSIDLPKQTPKYVLSKTYKDEGSNTDYAFLTYDMKMSMTFKQQEFDDKGKKMIINMMKVQGMEAFFEDDSKVNINAPNRMVIFISDDLTDNKWKMLNYDPNSPIFSQLMPTTVIEKAKGYYQDILLVYNKKN
ncbi:MAG: hypothetical protein HKP48_10550 [Winogradskyella sp.]|uniref:hypothetical protein n=1 Tax=Winogradskyella sp. TaxID=1883156 RepID=UPI0017CE49A0|nr:hypothetical protein [Winogradskyella sp.]MBT8245923.1 hypothetical protein [Winogradskyella sp.]NNK23703.1 hypothetical protein [Winogradskyella sp.]